MKVEEFGVRRVQLREDEVLEGDGHYSFCTKPSVGDCLDYILRRKGV